MDEIQFGVGGPYIETGTYSTYDADGRLIEEKLENGFSAGPASYDDTFSYDLNSNRMQETVAEYANNQDLPQATVNYTYNGDDQRLTETRTGIGAYSITNSYDANGSLTESVETGGDAQTDNYTWDLRNRMTQAAITENGATTTTTYGYDSNGDRISESVTPPAGQGQTSTTYFLNDPELTEGDVCAGQSR